MGVKLIQDWFTERDGTSWDVARMIGVLGAGSMIYKFIATGTPDYQGFGIALGAIIAAIAAKNLSEKP